MMTIAIGTHSNQHTQPYVFTDHSSAATNVHSDGEALIYFSES